jgi:hypothetical protein
LIALPYMATCGTASALANPSGCNMWGTYPLLHLGS